jgi:hypothetical protein
MRYDYRSANGQICCQTDNIAHLCAACRVKARTPGVPPPPDLQASIRRHRATRITVADQQERKRHYFARPLPMADGRLP